MSDSPSIRSPCGSVSIAYKCFYWFSFTLSYLLKCLVIFSCLLDMVFEKLLVEMA